VIEAEAEDPVVPVVPFDACLEKFAAEATLPDYYSPALGGKGRASVAHRLASFPPYLMVHLQKYVPNACVAVLQHCNLTRLDTQSWQEFLQW
jgi:ubiquitin carboxyl-terminal hydrolase 5/13